MLSIRLCVPWVREKVLCGFPHTIVMPDMAAYLVHGRTQRGFEGGSPNPAGGLGGAVSPPAGSGAEPRKILKLTLFRG